MTDAARQQRVRALARWITTRAEVILLMRRALALADEALLSEGSADGEPAPSNASMMWKVRVP
jgi:hypothetical protein